MSPAYRYYLLGILTGVVVFALFAMGVGLFRSVLERDPEVADTWVTTASGWAFFALAGALLTVFLA